jgi:hypothetical protein
MNITKTAKKILLPGAKLLCVIGLCFILFTVLASAEKVVEGFSSNKALQPGLVVALDKSAAKTVKSAEAEKPGEIYGVVVDPSDAPITLVGENSKVFVATTGTYPVLVSVVNGSIKSGDLIAMSNVDGIAARADNSQPLILGKAASGFDGTSKVITTSEGKAIGRILVNLSVGKNPLSVNDPALPGFLKKVSNSVANKSVPVIRIYTALFVFMISIMAAVTILWSGVRSSLISLGRNPLSRHSIFIGMYKVVFTGLGVFIIGLAGVYLLLKI